MASMLPSEQQTRSGGVAPSSLLVQQLSGLIGRTSLQSTCQVSRSTSSLMSPPHQTLYIVLIHPDNFASWIHFTRITAWCRRFIINTSKRLNHTSCLEDSSAAVKTIHIPGSAIPIEVPELSVSELEDSKCVWIHLAQHEVHGHTFQLVQSASLLPGSSPLLKLQPQMDTTHVVPVMQVHGRLRAAHHLPIHIHNPVLLPAKHRVTKLIVSAANGEAKHSIGTNHLLSNRSCDYWVVKGKTVVKEHRNKCIQCRKMSAKAATPPMSLLPDFRTSEPLQPFTKTGVNFAGSFLTKTRHRLCSD